MTNCETCRLPRTGCICAHFPQIDIPIRILVVRHRNEAHSQSNTGALVHHILKNSAIVPFGEPDSPLDLATLYPDDVSPAVLLPIAGSRPLTREAFTPIEKSCLIVLDGTWRKARRMSRRIPGLRSLPFYSLPPAPTQDWHLRRPPSPDALSTIEAVASAVEILGQPEAASELRIAQEFFMKTIRRFWGRHPTPEAMGRSS